MLEISNISNIDKELTHNISVLSKTYSKLSNQNKNELVYLIADLINFYVHKKIELELEKSLKSILKIES